MTIWTNTAEGQTSGTTATTANTGGGSGDSFVILAGNTVIFSNEQAHSGVNSYKLTSAAEAITFALSAFAEQSAAIRFYMYLPGAPTGTTDIVQFRNGSTHAAKLQIHTDRKIVALNDVDATVYASSPLPTGQWLRVESRIVVGTNATDGTIVVEVYAGEATTSPLAEFASSVVNTGTSNITAVRFGKLTAAGNFTLYLDTIETEAPRTSLIGPLAEPIVGNLTGSGPMWKIDATALSGGNGTLTHSISPSTNVVEAPEGVFWVPLGIAEVEYTITSTDGTSPVTNVITAPAGIVDGIRQRRWTGTEWV